MSWSTEEENTVRRMWLDGYSASAIGSEIGKTRNAVIGKVHRSGLSKENVTKQKQINGNAPKPKKPFQLSGFFQPKAKPKPKEKIAFCDPVSMPVAESRMVTLMQLRKNDCRWPIGDPSKEEFRFCGAPKRLRSYCFAHAVQSYR